MASSLNSSITSLLLNPYASYSAQVAQQARGGLDGLKPGASVNARYTLEADGSLALREVKVDAVADSTSEQAQQRQLATPHRQSGSFADFVRPRAQLSPSDELSLFATALEQAQGEGEQPFASAQPARNALGAGITEIEFDQRPTTPAQVLSLAEQQQARTASLYARNADITFNIDPVYSQAA